MMISLLQLILTFFIVPRIIAESFRCEKDGFFPDQRDCWIYHICVGATHSVKACKEDLLFNPIKNECDWAMNVNCNHTSSPESTSPSTPVRLPSNRNHSIWNDLCQSVDNAYIAHPTDCKRYAYCANGVPQIKLCKKSLLWSQTEQMCVWPAQSDCPAKSLTSTTFSTRTTSLTTESGTLPALPVTKSSILCPPDRTGRVPDLYDCSIYHDCHRGTDLVSYCPVQLQYNPKRQTCDLAQNVQCKNKCTRQNEGTRFVDPVSCCHFYQCKSGKLISQACSYPSLFDIQTRKCLSYKKVKCDGRRSCLNKCHYTSNYHVGKSLCDSGPSCAGYSDGFYPDRTKANCQFYIQCLDSRVANYSQCVQGQRFNKNMGRCTMADQVPCLASQSVQFVSIVLILPIISTRIL